MTEDKCPECGDPGGLCAAHGLEKECLRRQLAQAQARIAELEAELARIPQAADGKRIWPGDRLWYITRLHPEPLWIDVDHWCWCNDDGVTEEAVVWGETQHEPMDSMSASVCHSTYEAALAAKETDE